MTERVKLLIQKRTSLKAQITSLTNLIEKDRYDKPALKLRMARITDLYSCVRRIQRRINFIRPER